MYREHYYTAVRAGTYVQPCKYETHEWRRASDGVTDRARERTIERVVIGWRPSAAFVDGLPSPFDIAVDGAVARAPSLARHLS